MRVANNNTYRSRAAGFLVLLCLVIAVKAIHHHSSKIPVSDDGSHLAVVLPDRTCPVCDFIFAADADLCPVDFEVCPTTADRVTPALLSEQILSPGIDLTLTRGPPAKRSFL